MGSPLRGNNIVLRTAGFLILAAVLLGWNVPTLAAKPDGQLELRALDSQSGESLPVRIELFNARGRPTPLRNVGMGHLGSHFYLPPSTTLLLQRGNYTFNLDAGPEYRTQQGRFEIDRHASDIEEVEMRRFASLPHEGWWGADLLAQRPGGDLPMMAAVEGLNLVANVAWRFDGTRWQATDEKVRRPIEAGDIYAAGRELKPCGAIFESPGGDLLLIGRQAFDRPPLELAPGTTSCQCIAAARQAGLRVIALSPTAWELPLWVALGEVDMVMLLGTQSQWATAEANDPKGRPREARFYPGGAGLTRWGERIYHHLLNAGMRVVPLAGSASGITESPLGTNRVYVHSGPADSGATWWEQIAAGKVVVTNGPLLRPRVGGDPPGATFLVEPGGKVEFEIALNLSSRDQIDYLEILKNGEPLHEVRLADFAAAGGKLPPVPFDDGGWFAIRAVTGDTQRYQFAQSGPYYVAPPSGRRPSRESVEFFLTWLDELAARPVLPGGCTAEEISQAQQFWQQQLDLATAP